MAETGSCAASEIRRGRYRIGGGLRCETCMSDLSASECKSEQAPLTWYITENGQTAHRSHNCSALGHATISEVLSTDKVEDTATRSVDVTSVEKIPSHRLLTKYIHRVVYGCLALLKSSSRPAVWEGYDFELLFREYLEESFF